MGTKTTIACALLLGLLLSGCSTPCRTFTLKAISPGLFAGCRPRTQADFDALRAQGVRTILSFQSFKYHTRPERKRAQQNGIKFCDVPMFASPLPPTEAQVKKALLLMRAPGLRPLFIHCLYGRDRTAIVIGLYRVYFEHWSPEDAWAEAVTRWGFKAKWSLWGFRRYYWRHTAIPVWARQPYS